MGEIKFHVYYADKSESKRVIGNASSLAESESIIFHIRVNMSKVKYAKTKQIIKNLCLRIIQSSMRRDILNYSSAVKNS